MNGHWAKWQTETGIHYFHISGCNVEHRITVSFNKKIDIILMEVPFELGSIQMSMINSISRIENTKKEKTKISNGKSLNLITNLSQWSSWIIANVTIFYFLSKFKLNFFFFGFFLASCQRAKYAQQQERTWNQIFEKNK